MASVGAGKSLMLASILMSMQRQGKRALCLVNNAELVRNNCETFINQGGNSSIYCASLGQKDAEGSVIFGTPQSVLNGIIKNEDISNIKFNIIIIDEAHAINQLNDRSCFMRILRHFKQQYNDMRVLGATGTNFRFKGTAIVGEKCLFRSQVGNISTDYLIREKYLVEPNFKIDPELIIDFSKVKIKQNGQFDQKQLESVIEGSTRLTELICKQIVHIMESQNRFGVFIFATTKKHAYEILSHLPAETSALILGETKQDKRTRILNDARMGKIKYLVNIAIISVGVDVPTYDTIAYLRPTESLVLLVQTMGRALRLSTHTKKESALVLDFAGNIERHRDWDNPILLKALEQTIDEDKPHVILCPQCQTMNTESTRRCTGLHEKVRCSYYFEFKQCVCGVKNDIASRHCRACQKELIDPNEKLKLIPGADNELKELQVLEAKYATSNVQNSFRVNCFYKCKDKKGEVGNYFESYVPSSEKAKHFFYGSFVKKHCSKPSAWYTHLQVRNKMDEMLKEAYVPEKIFVKEEDKGYRIKKKVFLHVASTPK